MSEFGHTGVIVAGFGCLDSWGAGPFVLSVEDKSFRFEDSDRFGPLFLKKDGDPREKQCLPEHSPFWRAHRIWVRQGRRTADDGVTCLWDEVEPNLFRRIGPRSAVLVKGGDPDGKYIEFDGE